MDSDSDGDENDQPTSA